MFDPKLIEYPDGLEDRVDYRLLIEFDRYVAQVAGWLIDDLRAGRLGTNGSAHLDEVSHWSKLVCVRGYALPEVLAPDGNNLIDYYVVTHAVGRGLLEPDPTPAPEKEYRYRLTANAPRGASGGTDLPPVEALARNLRRKLAAEPDGWSHNDLRRAVAARQRGHFDAAIESLVAEGHAKVTAADRGQNGRRYVATG